MFSAKIEICPVVMKKKTFKSRLSILSPFEKGCDLNPLHPKDDVHRVCFIQTMVLPKMIINSWGSIVLQYCHCLEKGMALHLNKLE